MKKMPKNAEKFYCEKCNFICSKKSNYESHLLTAKHRNRTISNDFSPKNAEYFCDCGKRYTARNSLWYHKKKCTFVNDQTINPSSTIELETESETEKVCKRLMPMFKEMVMDMAPALQPNHTVNNINDNRKFNINMFLNDQCKDAINMSDFIKSIEITVDDMMKIGMDGQTKGMSDILIKRLKDMDMYKRPVHCSDLTAETIYIKDEDKWQEEEDNRPALKKALDDITVKTIQKLPDMCETKNYSKTADEILKDPREDKKIIKNLVKEVCIDPV